MCDLQVCCSSNAAETYMLIEREMESVGCPHFIQRAEDADRIPLRICVYNFGLDAGPDNVGQLNRIRGELKGINNVMLHVVFCMFHQLHLVVKAARHQLSNDLLSLYNANSIPKNYQ